MVSMWHVPRSLCLSSWRRGDRGPLRLSRPLPSVHYWHQTGQFGVWEILSTRPYETSGHPSGLGRFSFLLKREPSTHPRLVLFHFLPSVGPSGFSSSYPKRLLYRPQDIRTQGPARPDTLLPPVPRLVVFVEDTVWLSKPVVISSSFSLLSEFIGLRVRTWTYLSINQTCRVKIL